jgi:hypothetical protein
MLLSINKLSELTGRDRRTITKQLEDLHFVDGEKGSHLYESSEAFSLIYRVDNLDAAKAKQALSAASLNKIKEEVLRKERVPLQLVMDEVDSVFQAMAAILKNCKGKPIGETQVNEIFAKFRDIPKQLKW